MKILWHSNGPNSPTGYGNQTALFAERIHQVDGYEMAISAFYGVQATPMVMPGGIICLPPVKDLYGDDVIQAHMDFVKADMVFSLLDPFALDAAIWAKLPWAAWAPVDSEPDKPGNINVLRHARWVIAMSRFGEKVLRDAGLNPLYVPHGVDTKVFTPINRDEARARLAETWEVDLTGKHLLVTNMANKGFPSRKNFDALLQAFQGWLMNHPDSVLYIHTEKLGMWGGEHLPTMIGTLGIPPEKVIFPQQYRYLMGMWGVDYLNDVYNAGDVYVHPSQGEGFGIPIVEAQAAGCPVIVTDFSAMSELCFAGEKVPGIPVMSVPGAFQRKISVPGMLQALEKILCSDNQHYQKLREDARAGALEYDIENVMKKYMMPVLKKIKNELIPRKTLADRREIRRLKRNGAKSEPAYAVSVIIPAYGKAQTVERAIESVITQRGICAEAIVIDPQSPDGLGDVLKKYDGHPDVRIVQHENIGFHHDMNTAAALAKGRYIIPCEGDDWLEAGSLTVLAKALDENPEIGFVYGQVQYHNRSNSLFVPMVFRREQFFQHNASCYPVMFRKSLFDEGKVRWWQSSAGIGANDWEFNIQLAKASEGLALPDVLVLHYNFQNGTAWDDMQQRSIEVMNEIRARHPEVTAVMIP